MTRGIVFDIEEFALYDGPGIRSVIFLKGCPLRCQWCHNPEGLKMRPQRLKSGDRCIGCGACDAICPSADKCTACGACVKVCPMNCLRIAGVEMAPGEAAGKVLRNERMLNMSGGGVTFSGGEALMQPDFVIETRALMPGLHAAIETSGYADSDVFERVISEMDLVLFDIKLMDSRLHQRYTGVPNERILSNLRLMDQMGVPFRARIPLIPGVNDTAENLTATAELLQHMRGLERVELLRYNRAAGAKYAQLGEAYRVDFLEEQAPNADLAPFEQRGMEVIVL